VPLNVIILKDSCVLCVDEEITIERKGYGRERCGGEVEKK
jgi:hypothetical protein